MLPRCERASQPSSSSSGLPRHNASAGVGDGAIGLALRRQQASSFDERFEPVDVDAVAVDDEAVTAGDGLDGRGAEQLA